MHAVSKQQDGETSETQTEVRDRAGSTHLHEVALAGMRLVEVGLALPLQKHDDIPQVCLSEALPHGVVCLVRRHDLHLEKVHR